jgi:predicted small secreted protein
MKKIKTALLSSKSLFLVVVLLAFLLGGCTNPEGRGGDLTLTGKVIARKYNLTFTNLIAEYPLSEERVYIIYGNNEIYSDDFRTDYQGRYRFENLQPGKYTLFAYARDSTGNQPSGEIPVFVEVILTAGNPTTEAPNLILNK